MDEFTIKDSGERTEYSSGMMRDAAEDKLDYTSLLYGPMLDRYIAHLTKGRKKYPDPEPGVPNWTLAEGVDELTHAKRSLLRHVFQLLRDERDEDHAAAVWFNVNLIEYIRDKMKAPVDRGKPTLLFPPGTMIEYDPARFESVKNQHGMEAAIQDAYEQQQRLMPDGLPLDCGGDCQVSRCPSCPFRTEGDNAARGAPTDG